MQNKSHSFLLVILISLAAIMRGWGIGFGLPLTECRPDETFMVNTALKTLTGDLDPRFYGHPTLYASILSCAFALYIAWKLISAQYSAPLDFIAEYSADPGNFYLIDRLLSVSFGVATVFIVYKLTEELLDRKAALIAASFLSFCYMHIRFSHFGIPDVAQVFFIMCSMLSIAKAYTSKRLRDYLLAGIFAGLAASTKYVGIFLFFPMFAVHCLNTGRGRNMAVSLFFEKRIVIFTAAAVVFFLIGTPFALLDFYRFKSDLAFEVTSLMSRVLETRGRPILALEERGWLYHLRFSLFFGLGWSLLCASLLGILLFFKTNFRKAAVLFSFPLAFSALIGTIYVVPLRHTLPLAPFLCISGAAATRYAAARLGAVCKLRGENIAIAVLAVLIIAPSAWTAAQFNRLLAKEDNRLVAARWIRRNIPQGSSMYQSGQEWIKTQYYVRLEAGKPAEEGRGGSAGALSGSRLYSWQGWLPGYEQWEYDRKKRTFVHNNKEGSLPDYIVQEESPLPAWSALPRDIADLLAGSYVLRVSFEAIDMRNTKNIFDKLDAFYVPVAGFEGIQRPGPNMYVYERKRA